MSNIEIDIGDDADYTIEQVVVHHDHSWGVWPDTDNRDYTDLMAEREVTRALYEFGGKRFRVSTRIYPAYKPFADLGWAAVPDRNLGGQAQIMVGPNGLPFKVRFPWIDNTVRPPAEVMDKMLEDLTEISKDTPVILWDHVRNCWPEVASHLKKLFRLAIFNFADDCPGSSDIKTFPVCRHFDAMYYQMKIFDFATGERTATKYAALAPDLKPYFKGQNESNGLHEGLAAIGFDAGVKVNNFRAGLYPAIDFAFVGPAWPGVRKDLNGVDWSGLSTRLYGTGMRDGELDGRWATNPGIQCAKLYANTLFGINPQVSSIHNGRLIDLWRCHVCQLIYDPHEELAEEGFEPWVHYVPYDGTAADAVRLVRELRPQRDKVADILVAAGHKCNDYQLLRSNHAVYGFIYGEHLSQITEGR